MNLCAGGWVRRNETTLIPSHQPLGAAGGIEHSLEGAALTASLNMTSNVNSPHTVSVIIKLKIAEVVPFSSGCPEKKKKMEEHVHRC